LASHCCKWCKKDVHSAIIICSTVLSPREGAYFCNLACLRKYNRNPIGNGRQERMPEEHREGEPICTRADGHGGGGEEESCSKAAAAAAGQNWQRVGVAPAAAASSGGAAAAGTFTLEDIDDFVYDEMVLRHRRAASRNERIRCCPVRGFKQVPLASLCSLKGSQAA